MLGGRRIRTASSLELSGYLLRILLIMSEPGGAAQEKEDERANLLGLSLDRAGDVSVELDHLQSFKNTSNSHLVGSC